MHSLSEMRAWNEAYVNAKGLGSSCGYFPRNYDPYCASELALISSSPDFNILVRVIDSRSQEITFLSTVIDCIYPFSSLGIASGRWAARRCESR